MFRLRTLVLIVVLSPILLALGGCSDGSSSAGIFASSTTVPSSTIPGCIGSVADYVRPEGQGTPTLRTSNITVAFYADRERFRILVLPGTDANGQVYSLSGRSRLAPGTVMYSDDLLVGEGYYNVSIAPKYPDGRRWPDGFYKVFAQLGDNQWEGTFLILRDPDAAKAWYALLN